LRDLDHGQDVGGDGATGAGDLHIELLIDDLAAHAQDVVEGALVRARQPDVRGVDAEVVHQVQDLELVFDGRIANGWVLDAITERLVEELDLAEGGVATADLVPVVDELVVVRSEGLRHAWEDTLDRFVMKRSSAHPRASAVGAAVRRRVRGRAVWTRHRSVGPGVGFTERRERTLAVDRLGEARVGGACARDDLEISASDRAGDARALVSAGHAAIHARLRERARSARKNRARMRLALGRDREARGMNAHAQQPVLFGHRRDGHDVAIAIAGAADDERERERVLRRVDDGADRAGEADARADRSAGAAGVLRGAAGDVIAFFFAVPVVRTLHFDVGKRGHRRVGVDVDDDHRPRLLAAHVDERERGDRARGGDGSSASWLHPNHWGMMQ